MSSARSDSNVPALIEFGEQPTSAGFLHDLGPGRVRISMPSAPDPGQAIEFRFPLHPQSQNEIELRGRVIRSERNPQDRGPLWRHRVVVQFDVSCVPTLSSLFNFKTVATAIVGEPREHEVRRAKVDSNTSRRRQS